VSWILLSFKQASKILAIFLFFMLLKRLLVYKKCKPGSHICNSHNELVWRCRERKLNKDVYVYLLYI
jgi:hypothetical protein